jgi:hypothetical protein
LLALMYSFRSAYATSGLRRKQPKSHMLSYEPAARHASHPEREANGEHAHIETRRLVRSWMSATSEQVVDRAKGRAGRALGKA